MKILVLSFYFRPDLCAGAFRATPLVAALRKIAPADAHIDVITTLPNRYQSFSASAPEVEREAGFCIHRIALPAHQSGMLDQSKAFLAYARGVAGLVAGEEYDLVFATSSRLMTAVLGAWVARKKCARLYLDIRDIFVDTIKDVLPRKFTWLAKPLFSVLERRAVLRADKVNLVSAGFLPYFKARYPEQQFSLFTNGIDDEFLAAAPASPSAAQTSNRPLTVLYAGNLGEGQGLHAIVPQLAKALGARVQFKIIGDGGRRRRLEEALRANGVDNVELLPPVGREELLSAYRAADVLFLHLNDYEAFKKVLPSKLFEYAALGKPVWAGIAGYSAEFVRAEISNAAVFAPCDVAGAVSALATLKICDMPRTDFIARHARKNISAQMAADILSVLEG
jgi:glycosyltransferase involved in cell wall biosynthesis